MGNCFGEICTGIYLGIRHFLREQPEGIVSDISLLRGDIFYTEQKINGHTCWPS